MSGQECFCAFCGVTFEIPAADARDPTNIARAIRAHKATCKPREADSIFEAQTDAERADWARRDAAEATRAIALPVTTADVRAWVERRVLELKLKHSEACVRFGQTDEDRHLDRAISAGSKLSGYKEVLDYLRSHGA